MLTLSLIQLLYIQITNIHRMWLLYSFFCIPYLYVGPGDTFVSFNKKSHGSMNQDNYAGGEILETIAPALPIHAMVGGNPMP
jgi:hypothetical protein